jgi:signal transduction histidine kinase
VASQWRIRHKLTLGLVLVVATIGLLLGATLRGLYSYHLMIKNIGDSLEELQVADDFKESVAYLTQPGPTLEDKTSPAQTPAVLAGRARPTDPIKDGTIYERIKKCETRLDKYEKQLNLNAEHGRDPEYTEHQRGVIKALQEQFHALKKAEDELLNKFSSKRAGDPGPEEEDCQKVRACLAALEKTAADLRNKIYEDLNGPGTQSRPVYQIALWIIVPASVIGVLSIVGVMRVFRWVFYPIRDLEAGVKRLATGDFDHRIQLNSGDEMEDLAAAFNDMTGRLRDLYGDLARQVNERSRQLVRSERLASVGFLAAGVAHEINNPLASIAFCSEALEARLAGLLRLARSGGRRSDDEEVFARYLKMIQEEAFRCKKITEKLLEFSRSAERRREPTDLAGLVQSVIDITQHLQSCKGKQIVFDPVDHGRVAAPVNAEEIKSVVLNLVVNALDSMEEGGRLTIRLGLRDGMAEMQFTDTGCGMTQEVLENIFEPFFTRSRTGKGTGLGLTISHRIINQHGGEIEASSAGPNRGSTFVVRLPLTEREPTPAQPGHGERSRRAA